MPGGGGGPPGAPMMGNPPVPGPGPGPGPSPMARMGGPMTMAQQQVLLAQQNNRMDMLDRRDPAALAAAQRAAATGRGPPGAQGQGRPRHEDDSDGMSLSPS
jgi:hypothetical protein